MKRKGCEREDAFEKNLIFALCVLLAAGGLALWGALSRGGGATARVDVADEQGITLSLQEDGVYHIDSGRLPVTLEVKDGAVRFANSVCPDHLCEGFGWLRKEHDQAICMPAGVVVTVEE